MSETSKIEWTRSTFNPWIGFTKVSPGCDNCYAEVTTPARSMKIHWGAGQQRHRTTAANWNQVRKRNAKAAETGEFWPVFTASLADIFDNEVPDEWRSDFWALARDCPYLTLQVLTKRIGNAPRMLPADWGNGYPNVWLGIPVVNQEEADRDIPKLLTTPAAVRWLSMEPLLGPVDLTQMPNSTCLAEGQPYLNPLYGFAFDGHGDTCNAPSIDGVVVGGESGLQARPMHPDWARSLRDQCAEAGVPFLFKQWGEWAPTRPVAGGDLGGDMLRDSVRILKPVGENDGHFRRGDVFMRKVGKKAAGRLLDGRTWDELPHVSEIARVADLTL
jgi:protein gp37